MVEQKLRTVGLQSNGRSDGSLPRGSSQVSLFSHLYNSFLKDGEEIFEKDSFCQRNWNSVPILSRRLLVRGENPKAKEPTIQSVLKLPMGIPVQMEGIIPGRSGRIN